MSHILLLFSNSDTLKSTILNLQKNGWLNTIEAVTIKDCEELKSFYLAAGGVSTSELFEKHKGLILIDDVFYANEAYIKNGDSIAISYKMSDVAPELLPMTIAFYAQAWIAQQHLTTTTCTAPNCLMFDRSNLAFKPLCSQCQEKLPPQLTVSLLALSLLKELPEERVIHYIGSEIGFFLKDNKITVYEPAAKVAIAKYVTDNVVDSNENTRKFLADSGAYAKDSKDVFKRNYAAVSKHRPAVPTFIASRRWNSWTPNIPGLDRKTSGGGYFVSDGTSNIVIDPGYGLLQMLAQHGICIMDIAAIIVTHDHPDHIAELQNILSLRYEFRETSPKMKIFLNGSTHYLYERLASYYAEIIEGVPVNVNHAGPPLTVGGMTIETCKMHHKEIYDYLPRKVKAKVKDSAALGLRINGSCDGKVFNFAILGDTSFPHDPAELVRLASFYGKPDIAAFHLGSVEPEWNTDKKASDVHYGDGKHLGLNGVIRATMLLEPKVAVITEFGEEHDRNDDRLSIAAVIREACNTATTAVIPSDTALQLVIYDDSVLAKCGGPKCNNYVHTKNIQYTMTKNHEILYSFPSGCKSGLSHYKL